MVSASSAAFKCWAISSVNFSGAPLLMLMGVPAFCFFLHLCVFVVVLCVGVVCQLMCYTLQMSTKLCISVRKKIHKSMHIFIWQPPMKSRAQKKTYKWCVGCVGDNKPAERCACNSLVLQHIHLLFTSIHTHRYACQLILWRLARARGRACSV